MIAIHTTRGTIRNSYVYGIGRIYGALGNIPITPLIPRTFDVMHVPSQTGANRHCMQITRNRLRERHAWTIKPTFGASENAPRRQPHARMEKQRSAEVSSLVDRTDWTRGQKLWTCNRFSLAAMYMHASRKEWTENHECISKGIILPLW